ncbi:hypothetical protein I4P58_20425 [Enterobacter roggenkampii]|uniref:hypothetical protein n=1 Tax=Enterobacter roggenkampii TaxID=1812935 RepID=UPI0018C2421F|nr:hypothetical protein [Enterobacter roggenkampii]MBF9819375.1 hypothetical protein [Enterobacter roggenkampii]
MTIKPVADLYLITYEDGKPYRYTRDADEAIDAIEGGFKVKEFVSLENHRAAMLQGAENAGSPTTMKTAPALDSSPKIAESTSGNSPVIPDGWVMVPVELTGAMTNAMTDAILDDLHNVDVWRSVLAAAPLQEVKP